MSDVADWLAWQDTLNPAGIDLGLDRLRPVEQRLALHRPGRRVITVGGTNGKGSCVAFIEAICLAAGVRVGSYTSPHLRRFNERVRLCGEAVSDESLLGAFRRVESSRSDVPLTAFEFQTLAALSVLSDADLEIAVLEVGLGGRLDAVNLVDPDVAVITSVDLDHQDWLGSDRDSIGREKAGISRPGMPAVVGEPTPPTGMLRELNRIGADARMFGSDFRFERERLVWQWEGSGMVLSGLPFPLMAGEHQLRNGSVALEALDAAGLLAGLARACIERGLREAFLPGRFQIVPGPPEVIVDVAHNPAAAQALAAALSGRETQGRTLAVLGMLADKDVRGVYDALSPCVEAWYIAGLAGKRGMSAGELQRRLPGGGAQIDARLFASVEAAVRAARSEASAADRVIALGSFKTAGDALASLEV